MQKRKVYLVRGCFCAVIAGLILLAVLLPGEASRVKVSAQAREGPLAGHVIAIDAGHGGYDGGARSPSGQWEKVYNLDIALRLQSYLHELGATVIMTRDGDYALCDPNPKMRKKRQDMERRAELVLSGEAELLVSIHMNEYRDRRQSGPQVFFRGDCEAGELLAQTLQQQMIEALSPKRQRAASPGDFYILSLGIPSALVECGFLSNSAEEALLRTDVYCDKVAKSIGDGIVAWFALESRPEATEREDR